MSCGCKQSDDDAQRESGGAGAERPVTEQALALLDRHLERVKGGNLDSVVDLMRENCRVALDGFSAKDMGTAAVHAGVAPGRRRAAGNRGRPERQRLVRRTRRLPRVGLQQPDRVADRLLRDPVLLVLLPSRRARHLRHPSAAVHRGLLVGLPLSSGQPEAAAQACSCGSGSIGCDAFDEYQPSGQISKWR